MARKRPPAKKKRGVKRRKLVGSEKARVFTPPLRRLTKHTSFGFLFVEFCDAIGVELYPWQRWLAIHAMELAPGLTVKSAWDRPAGEPLFRFRQCIVLVARQNGKTTFMTALALFHLFVLDARLVLSTAQDLSMARETWQNGIEIIQDTDELVDDIVYVRMTNSQEKLQLTGGRHWIVKPPNRRAVRGRSADLVLLDELREHQSWTAWAAISKTMMARPDAQLWGLSNAGDEQSLVLKSLRDKAHELLGDPDGVVAAGDVVESGRDVVLSLADDVPDPGDVDEVEDDGLDVADAALGWFEWSAAPDRKSYDRVGWAEANPALGHGFLTERSLAASASSDPLPLFQAECLCQFPAGRLDGLFPAGMFEQQADVESRVGGGEMMMCSVSVAHDRSRAVIGLAGRREDGRVHVGVIAARAGTEWVVPFLTRQLGGVDVPPFSGVVVQEKGAPESSLIPSLEAAGVPLVLWSGSALAGAWGQFYDDVALGVEGRVRHRNQPLVLQAALSGVTRSLGDGLFPDRRNSVVDVAPLIAVIGAKWGLTVHRTSAYESGGLNVV